MKFKEAQAKARQDIADEKAALESHNAELQQQIDNHVEGAKAAQDIADISKGIIPESAKPLIEQRAQQIREGLQESPLARGSEQHHNDLMMLIYQFEKTQCAPL